MFLSYVFQKIFENIQWFYLVSGDSINVFEKMRKIDLVKFWLHLFLCMQNKFLYWRRNLERTKIFVINLTKFLLFFCDLILFELK